MQSILSATACVQTKGIGVTVVGKNENGESYIDVFLTEGRHPMYYRQREPDHHVYRFTEEDLEWLKAKKSML